MKKFFALTIGISISAICISLAQMQSLQPPFSNTISENYWDGQLYLKLKNESSIVLPEYNENHPVKYPVELDTLIQEYKIYSIQKAFPLLKSIELQHTYKILFHQNQDIEKLIKALEKIPYVEYVEKIPVYKLDFNPNDVSVASQYALTKINAFKAWNISTGNSSIKIAIVDNAVKLTHEDLNNNKWVNSGEISGNGIDDDGNGYIDDINGFDVGDNDPDPNPPASASNSNFTHGTHCAGIASGVSNNSVGIASIGYDLSLIGVKCNEDNILDPQSIHYGWEGVQYAIAAEADIISLSWGRHLGGSSQTEQNIINDAWAQGIIICASAGNDGTDWEYYPAQYDNVFTVGNTDANDAKAILSNYGTWIDLMAPGEDIYSSLAGSNSSYGFLSGTSMSTPMVAGLCGLVKSVNPLLTNDQIITLIKNNCDKIDQQNSGYIGKIGSGRINAYHSLLSALPGDFVWAKGMGSTGDDYGKSIVVDVSGNVYTTGYFNGTVDFDPGTGISNLISGGGNNVFISKLDNSGNFIWAKQLGGVSNAYGHSIAIDATGNVYTTGFFDGTVDFNPGVGTFNMVSQGMNDIFISKLDNSGNFVWAKQIGGVSDDKAFSLAVDGSGNVYTTGSFLGIVDFDPGPNNSPLTSSSSSADIFISKLNNSGNFLWAKQIGSTSIDEGFSITVDASGNAYTTGNFTGTVDFDPGAGTVNLISSSGSLDIFVSKLSSSGSFVWAKKMGSTLSDIGNSIIVDAMGNVYTTGVFQGTVDFNPGAGTNNLTTSSGALDMFISKLDNSGNFVWAKDMGGSSFTRGYSIALDPAANVYTTGYFYGSVDFNPDADVFILTPAGLRDVFVCKLNSNGNFVWARGIGGTSNDYGYSLALDSSGNIYTTGIFQNTVDFDAGTSNYNIVSVGAIDFFIEKMGQPQPCVTCPIPYNIAYSNITSSKVTINWSGNDCSVKYRIRIRPQGTTTWSTVTVTAPTTIKTITGLLQNTTYEFQVRTDCNTTGTIASAYSSIQTFSTPCSCDKPTNIFLTGITQTSATVNWTGNICAYQYKLQYRKQGITAWTTKTITPPAVSKVLTGLLTNTTYEFRLRTDCFNGTSNSGFIPIQTFATLLRLEEVNSSSNGNQVLVYPNPASDELIIEVQNETVPKQIEITDAVGRVILNLTPNKTKTQENIQKLSSGVYFVKVYLQSGEVQVKKVVKE